MKTSAILGLVILVTIGCGGADPGEPACGGGLETSCDVPSDDGAHTCYDVMPGVGGIQQANATCTQAGGTVLPACCDHAGAIARCVFVPTEGGSDTEWFLSGSVSAAQSACMNNNGSFTAL